MRGTGTRDDEGAQGMSTTEDHPDWIEEEDALCTAMVAAVRELAAAEKARSVELSNSLRELLAQRQEACGDPTQRAAIDDAIAELERARTSHQRTHRVQDLDAATPYFGHLVLEEKGAQRQVLIAKGSAVDSRLPVNVVDWRNAPISRLYYDYDEGDEFSEVIAGRTREGDIVARRTLDIRGGVLQSVETAELVSMKKAGNTWVTRRRADQVLERSDLREDPEDHSLPDIVALITREQFSVLTRPESGVVLLRGQAGSGKTTVALHRVAYLRYQDPERFRLNRVLVVMFNKSLQTYIRKALSELDLLGVRVSTFHGWARGALTLSGMNLRFEGSTPDGITAIKQHPAMEALLTAYVQQLGDRLVDWLPVPESCAETWRGLEGRGLARLEALFAKEPAATRRLRIRVHQRLGDHTRDLRAMFSDVAALTSVLPAELHGSIRSLTERESQRAGSHTVDFADAALLLRLGQLKVAAGSRIPCPWRGCFAHIVVDEAQDLSVPELRAILDAADEHRSITIAGDPAQTLYRSGSFDLLGGGASELQAGLTVNTLGVGHRSTRPIMALALQASGRRDDALLARTRVGHPVVWLRGDQADARTVAKELRAFASHREQALVAVLCRDRRTADTWAGALMDAGLPRVRRAHRDGFGFESGVVVSNVHQVKGLEFDGVVLVEPGAYRASERNLLHVAITRAADRLWVVSRGRAGFI